MTVYQAQAAAFAAETQTTAEATATSPPTRSAAIDASPETKACRAAFEALLALSADIALGADNLNRLAREYRRAEHRGQALEKVLLPEVAEGHQAGQRAVRTMEREETIRTRRSSQP